MRERPIGIFDSGLGGLTVLKEIKKLMPGEDLIYFGDTKRVPYGPRPKEEIIDFSLEIVDFLLKEDIKALVIACNTISSVALEAISSKTDLEVLGVIKPGVEYALSTTNKNKLGLIGTKGTVESKSYEIEGRKLKPELVISATACPEFVKIVETSNKKGIDELMEEYLSVYKDEDIDSLILGCTHFPVLRDDIESYLGEDIKLIDPALATAEKLKKLLEEKNLLSKKLVGEEKYFVTARGENFKAIGSKILKREIKNLKEIEL